MKSNITFIALNKSLKKEIAKNLANKLEMFYIDINEFIQYQLQNINDVISINGLEYYNEEETRIVKTISTYENSLITLNLDTFFNANNYKYLKSNSLFIYLKVDFETYKTILDNENTSKSKTEKSLNKKVFNERDEILNKVCDIVISYTEKSNLLNEIINSIKVFYKEVL